jgi:LacI family transcriptional regulator
MRNHGIRPLEDWVSEGLEPSLLGGREGVAWWLEMKDLPTAIVCTNDWMAAGALNELTVRGLRVPRDVSLVGHDNIGICEQLQPLLTSVDGRVSEVVELAIDLLRRQLEGEALEAVDRMVEARLVWRESCAGVTNPL